jgi:glycosyltransferase involved in cell wall biosynthesis
MTKPILHQISVGITIGDAISDQAFLLQRWLREMGYESEIYAEHFHSDLKAAVRPIEAYQPQPGERYVIFHHSIGSAIVERLLAMPLEFILIYHNVTPPQFFNTVDQKLAEQMVQGQAQLLALKPRTVYALADSAFNEAELMAAGFPTTGVLSIVLDESRYEWPTNPALASYWQARGPLLLFVGRLVPNKKQEDLIKLLYYYRRIEPTAQLVFIGGTWLSAYDHWLKDLAGDLGLAEAVKLTGHVSQQDMVSYYRLADLYVSMSEHEGFGKPLIESMYLGLPVLAYASTAVPGTMGQAGVLFHEKNYEVLAELVDILVRDIELRRRIITCQRAEVERFLGPQVRRVFQSAVEAVMLVER